MQLFKGILALCASSIFCITGCSATLNQTAPLSQSQLVAQKSMMAQIIIKFRDPALDPSLDNFIRGLSRDANAALVFVRPMSGGAYVFRVENIADDTHLANVIQRLSKRADVLYVEQDAIMRHHIK